jgi:hypothetical protein
LACRLHREIAPYCLADTLVRPLNHVPSDM